MLHLINYIKGTTGRGLFLPYKNDLNMNVFCDANWAACERTRRSKTGYCIFLGDAVVSWKSKKQDIVSRSSAEAEYRSLATVTCEAQWILYILKDLEIDVKLPVQVWCDNEAAVHIVENPVFHERTKHIEIDCHLVRDKYKAGLIDLNHVSSKEQVADMFTKFLAAPQFNHLLGKLGLVDYDQLQLEEGVMDSVMNYTSGHNAVASQVL